VTTVGLVILCYLIGAIPFSYLASSLSKGVDIRTQGSGNVGATNVLRTAGWPAALLALSCDLLKGVIGAWLGFQVGGPLLAVVCSIVTVVGHCYPVYLRFRGGKGVATAAGTILYLMPNILFILLAVFIITVAISRYVSLASLVAAMLFPILTIVLAYPWSYTAISLLMSGLVIYSHRNNIVRLRNGTESRIGEKVS